MKTKVTREELKECVKNAITKVVMERLNEWDESTYWKMHNKMADNTTGKKGMLNKTFNRKNYNRMNKAAGDFEDMYYFYDKYTHPNQNDDEYYEKNEEEDTINNLYDKIYSEASNYILACNPDDDLWRWKNIAKQIGIDFGGYDRDEIKVIKQAIVDAMQSYSDNV